MARTLQTQNGLHKVGSGRRSSRLKLPEKERFGSETSAESPPQAIGHSTPEGLLLEVEFQISEGDQTEARHYLNEYAQLVLFERREPTLSDNIGTTVYNTTLPLLKEILEGKLRLFEQGPLVARLIALTRREILLSDRKHLIPVLDEVAEKALSYVNLRIEVVKLLTERLKTVGMSEAKAALTARSAMTGFRLAHIKSAEEAREAVELAVATAKAVLHDAAGNFMQVARLALPPGAPETWADRDRSKGETPIDFLRRVWGSYMDAGILYQDDIKRLGDDKLVRAIRSYCQKHPDIEPANVLPPPSHKRLENALAAAPPNSAQAAALRTRMGMRDAARRHAQKRRGSGPKPR